MKFIIRLFPEISIKSKPVRNRLIKLLEQNLINVAKGKELMVHTHCQWDKIFIEIKNEPCDNLQARAIEYLSNIPGIHSFLSILEFNFQSPEDIFAQIKDILGPKIVGKTFALRVKRRGNHTLSSQEFERVIGGMFKANFNSAGVVLNKPEVTLNIEIDQNKVFVINDIFKGQGGYPVGSQGEVISLISGGYDSGVSTYRAIRRGLKVHYLFFNLGGDAHEIGVKQESYYLWKKFASSHRVKFITVPFERVVEQILQKTHHGIRGVILKRKMMEVASEIAKLIGAQAIVTGEAVGQVSSQTLINLSHIDKACRIMLLRPLAMVDKQDIIDESVKIGTEPFAKSMPEYCGVISDHPNVCPSEEFILEQEALMDNTLVDDAVQRAKHMDIKFIPDDMQHIEQSVSIVNTLNHNDIVIDVRSNDDMQKHPLVCENEVIHIPFYKLQEQFASLDKLKNYALYCDQGVMSIMQAKVLKAQGYHNVKVLRFEK